MPVTALEFLVAWYAAQCDGDWEHEYGISIETVDNPGWKVDIPLAGTELEGSLLERVRTEDGDSWMLAWSDGSTFYGRCGSRDLPQVLERFRDFHEAATRSTASDQ